MMEWNRLLSPMRFGQEELTGLRQHARSEFQRDYDRIVFSSPFRRLQNKTQVFPLPGSVFVHNRLTHSLEVSCVGRSLANNAATALAEKYAGEEWAQKFHGLDDIVATACLAHDMGNPPFGHSGERAITSYFRESAGQRFREVVETEQQWCDLEHFEGNANAFRLLSHKFNGRRNGGFALTYTTLASVVKYPYASTAAGDKGKFGYFEAESESFHRLMDELGVPPVEGDETLDSRGRKACYCRHPLVYLVEAADDICYQIMDIEDAHRLRLLTTDETFALLLDFFEGEQRAKCERGLQYMTDVNEQVAYLRSRVIGKLVFECSVAFVGREELFLRGDTMPPLMKLISDVPKVAYKNCSAVAVEKLYKSADVVDIEVAGHQIISVLLDKLLDAVMHPEKSYSKLLLDRIPAQYETRDKSRYVRILSVLDYISGMTDVYALDLYRKILGMSLPSL